MNFKPKQSSVDQILELEVSLVIPYQLTVSQYRSFSWITKLQATTWSSDTLKILHRHDNLDRTTETTD